MRVSFLAGTLGLGGAEKQLFFMLRAARALGVSAHVLCLTRNEEYEEKIRSLGISVTWVGKPASRIKRLIEIISRLKRYDPDIIQSSHFFTNIYAGAAGRVLGKKSIGAIRSDLLSEIAEHGILGRWQVGLPGFLIANSSIAARNAIKRGISKSKIATVRNVVDTANATDGNGSEQPATFLFAGRLDDLKRPDKFLDLAALLVKKHPRTPMRFLVAGDGVLFDPLKKMAKKLDLSNDQFCFLGSCENMNDVYRQADILISTSVREGTSNVILEAMSNSIPVIATDAGGTPELLADRRGILVKRDAPDELVSAAEALLFDRDLRKSLGARGRAYVQDNHSLPYLENELNRIYGKLAATKIQN